MVSKEVLAAILTPIITLLGVVLFSTSQGLLITPNLTADITDPVGSTTQYEQVTIKNTGLIQAKKVQALIISEDPLQIVESSTRCSEGNYVNNTLPSKTLVIKFETLSRNVDCVLGFESPKNGRISYVAITGMDSSGFQWIYGKGQLKEFDVIGTLIGVLVGISSIAATFLSDRWRKLLQDWLGITYELSSKKPGKQQ